MTITRTLQNAPSETAESVDITPFNRSSWTITDTDARGNAISTTESRITGEDPEYPLVKRAEIRPLNLFHPGHEQEVFSGRKFVLTVFSTVKVEDSVSGLVTHFPYQFEIGIGYPGPTILTPSDALQFLLSVVSEVYDSVTTGAPDTTVINKIALGATDF